MSILAASRNAASGALWTDTSYSSAKNFCQVIGNLAPTDFYLNINI